MTARMVTRQMPLDRAMDRATAAVLARAGEQLGESASAVLATAGVVARSEDLLTKLRRDVQESRWESSPYVLLAASRSVASESE